MAPTRATALVAVVVGLAVAQILFEEALVFMGATGADAPGWLNSPYALVIVPFALFLSLAGVVWAWALTGENHRA